MVLGLTESTKSFLAYFCIFFVSCSVWHKNSESSMVLLPEKDFGFLIIQFLFSSSTFALLIVIVFL